MYLDNDDLRELAGQIFDRLEEQPIKGLYLLYRVSGQIKLACGYEEIDAVKEEAMKDPSRYFL